jgi:hypothetical protein
VVFYYIPLLTSLLSFDIDFTNVYLYNDKERVALMMEVVSTSETLVTFYQATRHNIPQDTLLHTSHRGYLKYHVICVFIIKTENSCPLKWVRVTLLVVERTKATRKQVVFLMESRPPIHLQQSTILIPENRTCSFYVKDCFSKKWRKVKHLKGII